MLSEYLQILKVWLKSVLPTSLSLLAYKIFFLRDYISLAHPVDVAKFLHGCVVDMLCTHISLLTINLPVYFHVVCVKHVPVTLLESGRRRSSVELPNKRIFD